MSDELRDWILIIVFVSFVCTVCFAEGCIRRNAASIAEKNITELEDIVEARYPKETGVKTKKRSDEEVRERDIATGSIIHLRDIAASKHLDAAEEKEIE